MDEDNPNPRSIQGRRKASSATHVGLSRSAGKDVTTALKRVESTERTSREWVSATMASTPRAVGPNSSSSNGPGVVDITD